jgi:hypothetical protein
MDGLQVMLVDVSDNYQLIMEQFSGDIQRRGQRKNPFVIPGRR